VSRRALAHEDVLLVTADERYYGKAEGYGTIRALLGSLVRRAGKSLDAPLAINVLRTSLRNVSGTVLQAGARSARGTHTAFESPYAARVCQPRPVAFKRANVSG
jgi:hypothetical protein